METRARHPLLEDYATYHQNGRNKALHFIGIPLIVLSLFGLLSLIRVEGLGDAGLWLLLFGVGWTAGQFPRLAIPYAVAMAALYALGRWLPWPALAGLFVVGWIFQLVGHRIEGKAPAFTQNAEHLFIGPVWIVARLIGKA